MARPAETTLSYFSLDCDFFSNRKVKALRRAHGTVGVLTYLNILCKVYGHGYCYKFDALDQLAFDIAEEIANDALGKVAARVSESINYMSDIGLLDKGCLDRGVLTSHSIQERYSSTIEKFKRKTKATEYGLKALGVAVEENAVNSEETGVNSEETPINSEKTQRKEKKKKEKIINNNTPLHARACDTFFLTIVGSIIDEITEPEEAATLWGLCLTVLEKVVNSLTFDVWIKPLQAIGFHDDKLVIEAPTETFACEVEKRYAQFILEALRTVGASK